MKNEPAARGLVAKLWPDEGDLRKFAPAIARKVFDVGVISPELKVKIRPGDGRRLAHITHAIG